VVSVLARPRAREAMTKSRSDDITQRFTDIVGDYAVTWWVALDVLHRGRHTRPVYSDYESHTFTFGYRVQHFL